MAACLSSNAESSLVEEDTDDDDDDAESSLVEEDADAEVTGNCCVCGNGSIKYAGQGSCRAKCGSEYEIQSKTRGQCHAAAKAQKGEEAVEPASPTGNCCKCGDGSFKFAGAQGSCSKQCGPTFEKFTTTRAACHFIDARVEEDADDDDDDAESSLV